MITINIDPVAFSLGPFAIPWYAIAVALAIAAVVIVALGEARRVGISLKSFLFAVGLAIPGGVAGAKLVHVIDLWEHYSVHPQEIFRPEGWALYGAILGALLSVWVYARFSGISFWRLGDLIAPGAPLGQAIGRIGCLIQGCCYGLPASLPWSIVYTHPRSYAPLGVPLHPAQAYFMLWNLVVFAVLWKLRGRLKPEGSLFLAYLVLYSVGDLGLRFLRQGEPFLFGLQQAQVIGLAILAVAVPLFILRVRRQ